MNKTFWNVFWKTDGPHPACSSSAWKSTRVARASMASMGNPYDNARMGSFYTTLKTEEVGRQEYVDLDDAQKHIGYSIADLYNRRRLHSSLGFVPPAEFAARYTAARGDLPLAQLDWAHSR